MQAVKLSYADILKIEGNVEHYHIPKYQREYVWGKYQWETLINDIKDNETDYFIGSVIVVNHSTDLRPGEEKIYQVIDGQQRLTTLSILLAAIYYQYSKLAKEVDENDEELKNEFTIKLNSLRNKLIKKKVKQYPDEIGGFMNAGQYCFFRVQPSTQSNNLSDYKYIMHDCGILKEAEYINYFPNRRFAKAYDFFWNEIPETKEDLDILLDKINRLVFIHISVSTQADAFTLFETLNNRGIDLSPIDIIKNNLLAEMEKQNKQDIDTSYENWQQLLKYIPDFDSQIRFLRQYYNAFKVFDEIKHEKFTRATKSNILMIYERLIKKDAENTFNELLLKGGLYGKLLGTVKTNNPALDEVISELDTVGGVPAYTLLLYLLQYESELDATTSITSIIEFMIKYYVRRNITDTPNTRDLDSINIEIVEACHKQIVSGNKISLQLIIDAHLNNTKAKPASLDYFKEWLNKDIYINNVWMTRYLLWKLDSLNHTREYAPDLWQRNAASTNFVWTIEHVFPEGANIPPHWVQMIANGNVEDAKQIQSEVVHMLGNLTLSAYNSNLATRDFASKQNLSVSKVGNNELKIGYKNGLSLNNIKFQVNNQETSLASITNWNKESIVARTQVMIQKIIEIFKFDNE